MKDCRILNEITGSDHCPVLLELQDVHPRTGDKIIDEIDREGCEIPAICCSRWDHFSKKQVKISEFFVKSHISTIEKQDTRKTQSPPKEKRDAPLDRPKKVQKTLAFFCKPKSTDIQAADVKEKEVDTPFQSKISSIAEEEPFPCLPADPQTKNAWKSLMKPPDSPLCDHKEPTKEYTVNKAGPNKGRKFYLCARPIGPKTVDGNGKKLLAEFRCDYFQWKKGNKLK